MLSGLIGILILALVLAVIYWVCGMFVQGRILQIIGVILLLIFLVRVLGTLGGLGGGAHYLD